MRLSQSVLEALRRQEEPRHFTPPAKLRVLGVDASLRSTGLGVVEMSQGRLSYIDARPVKNKPVLRLSECLLNLRNVVDAYIEEFKPEEVAFEGIFFSQNARTSLILGHARGTILSVCAEAGLPAYEYPPRRVKQAATGTGTASKDQMRLMMQRVLALESLPQEDAADALAIAVTHIHEAGGIAPRSAKLI
jgi:crossover junction endodeoxyribonuclease RuvC